MLVVVLLMVLLVVLLVLLVLILHARRYPTGSALGGTFNVSLVHRIALMTAVEVRGNVNAGGSKDGVDTGSSCYGPVSNLCHDVRTAATAATAAAAAAAADDHGSRAGGGLPRC